MIRLERILEETDRQRIGEQLQTYLKTGSDKYVYGLKSNELPRELEKLGRVYYLVDSTDFQGFYPWALVRWHT